MLSDKFILKNYCLDSVRSFRVKNVQRIVKKQEVHKFELHLLVYNGKPTLLSGYTSQSEMHPIYNVLNY